jgi:UDP-N-acetylmuramoylalanine--D-glutamate ligase
MNEVQGEKILVVGLGESGAAVCEHFLKRGARVTVTDLRTESEITCAQALRERGAVLECGGHREETFTSADRIVLSPGVPPTIPPLEAARRKGVSITGELELGAREAKAPLLAVTGTNGKGSTVCLLHHILARSGVKSVLAGNVGHPLLRAVEERPDAEVFVVEVSSFQLETIEQFHARSAVILNVTPDHLERYASFEAYRETKARVFLNQEAGDLALLNADEPWQRALAEKAAARVWWFAMGDVVKGQGAVVRNDTVLVTTKDGRRVEELISLSETRLLGRHNLQNIMAVALMAQDWGVPLQSIRKEIRSFSGLPHVMEFVADVGGVAFYNNSKATNVAAAVKSLEALETPSAGQGERHVVLLLGGRDKGGDYAPLLEAIPHTVKRLVLMGENREALRKILNGTGAELVVCDSLEEAVVRGAAGLEAGDVVLLAPAAASFDMFQDYRERGRVFSEAVKKLRSGVRA